MCRQRGFRLSDLVRQFSHLEVRLSHRPPRSDVRLLAEQGTQLAVEVACRLQEPVTDVLELFLLEQEAFADAGMKGLDRLDSEVVPGFDGGLGAGQFGVAIGQGDIGVCLVLERRGQFGLGPGLYGQHGRQSDHAGHQGDGRGGYLGTVPPSPSPRSAAGGSRQAVTGSSASQCSMSSASARGVP